MQQLRLGLVINPVAGIGGPTGLKGSDGENTLAIARQQGVEPKAQQRVATALELLTPYKTQLQFYTVAGDMGENVLQTLGFAYQVIYQPQHPSSASDSQLGAKAIAEQQPDLLLFAGGDGTARDICQVWPESLPVLGIPAGVKIHSGVYAVNPSAAARVIEKLLKGELASVHQGDVMDIDEQAFRQGSVKAKRFGEMTVPAELQYIQAVKMGGKESDELVLDDIAADVAERLEDVDIAIMGSGSTVEHVMQQLGLANTLLGVDIVEHLQVVANDVSESQLYDYLQQHPQATIKLVVTVIGGQGHLFGRGNQQLSPRIIRHIGLTNIIIVATKKKLQSLTEKGLQVDTGDPQLDSELAGLRTVVTGYHDEVLVNLVSVR